jgi:hypothetical protein
MLVKMSTRMLPPCNPMSVSLPQIVWRIVKAKIMTTMVIPTMLDGAECCTITARRMKEMESLYLRMVRSCLGVTTYTTRKYKMTNETLLGRLGVNPLHSTSWTPQPRSAVQISTRECEGSFEKEVHRRKHVEAKSWIEKELGQDD